MNFITTAIAHDATCSKGDEWLFHGMAEGKETPRKPGTEERAKTEAKADIEVAAFIAVLALAGIGVLLFNFLTAG